MSNLRRTNAFNSGYSPLTPTQIARYSGKPKYTYKKVSKASKYAKKDIAPIVRKMIAATEEVKCELNTSQASLNYTAAAGVVNIYGTLAPQIFQGAGQNARLGNKVKVKESTVAFALDVSNNITAPTPLLVRVMVLSYRLSPATTPATLSDLFQTANGGTAPANTVDLNDMVRPIYDTMYDCCYDKVFKIGSAGVAGVDLAAANNDFNLLAMDTIKIPLKYVLFNANSASNPVSKVWFMAVVVQPADRQSYTSGAVTDTNISITSFTKYTDA